MIRNQIICADVMVGLKQLPDNSVHCCVTSPPYWGLRDYGVDGAIGLEPTLDEFILNLVAAFREVHRVLHPSGVLWVNMGNSYASSPANSSKPFRASIARMDGIIDPSRTIRNRDGCPTPDGFKPKNLIPQAWLLGLALQQDGWWLRSEIIWHKLNPMPGSQKDRPTTSHETILMLTKSAQYSFFMDQIRMNGSINRSPRTVWTFATEPMGWQMCKTCKTVYAPDEYRRLSQGIQKRPLYDDEGHKYVGGWANKSSRAEGVTENVGNYRDDRKVCRTCKTTDQWLSHFAAFPQELVKRCILASTSNRGICSACGAQWIPLVDKIFHPQEDVSLYRGKRSAAGLDSSSGFANTSRGSNAIKIIDYTPSCQCNVSICPPLVLDPFGGVMTTGLVAKKLGREYVCIELNPDYCVLGEIRLRRETQQLTIR